MSSGCGDEMFRTLLFTSPEYHAIPSVFALPHLLDSVSQEGMHLMAFHPGTAGFNKTRCR